MTHTDVGGFGDALATPPVTQQPARLGHAAGLRLLNNLRRRPFDTMVDLSREYPLGVSCRVGRQEIVVVTIPAQVWELFTTHARRTTKGRGLENARRLLGDGLLTSEGEEHLAHRRALQPAFHPDHLQAYLGLMLAAADRTTQSWADGDQIELTSQMSAMTLDAVASALFGDDLRGRADDLMHALDDLMAGARIATLMPYGAQLQQAIPWRRRRLEAAAATLDSIVAGVVTGLRAARAERARGTEPTSQDAVRLVGRPTLTRQLLDGPITLSDDQIRDHVLTLLLAGHETTAVALTWAWTLLADAPHVREALDHEWAQQPETLIAQDLPTTLPLTTAVVAETFRLRPPAWLVGRRVAEPFTLGGFQLERGTLCLASPAGLHRDPRWWPDADQFDPHRWLGAQPSGGWTFQPRPTGQPRGAYLPFGAGPRMCIGDQFAWTEATALLATLGRRWHVEAQPPYAQPGPPTITLRPGDKAMAVVRARD